MGEKIEQKIYSKEEAVEIFYAVSKLTANNFFEAALHNRLGVDDFDFKSKFEMFKSNKSRVSRDF